MGTKRTVTICLVTAILCPISPSVRAKARTLIAASSRSNPSTPAQEAGPLKFIRSIDMPGVPTGSYTDQLAVDVKGFRLFATTQAQKSVQVLDIKNGKFLHEISGVGNAHAVLYRPSLNRIYIVEGDIGLIRIYNGNDYKHIRDIKLLQGADCIAYDPGTKYLYVTTGGEDAKLDYSMVTVFNTTTDTIVGGIRMPSTKMEDLVFQSSPPRVYVNMRDKNEIGVIDAEKRVLLTTWTIPEGKGNTAIALDEAHHRLFVGCRSTDMDGVVAVFDTQTGKETATLPIGGWVDYIGVDSQNQRLYAVCGTGHVYAFQQSGPDEYHPLGRMETAVMAKTGLLVPELKRLFVSIPQIGAQQARVLVFQTP